ncbi:MAG TPA: ThuA domain-containing protein [Chryseolinea sp.]
MKKYLEKLNLLRYSQFLLMTILTIAVSAAPCECQKLPKTLILTGNGNVPTYKKEYPPWIHEFHNEKVIEILKNITTVDVATDLNVLGDQQLQQYDLIISNSLFLTPEEDQLKALHKFVSNGKAYMTLHCGILSLLNWDRYEEFIGGIFIGGPSSVPAEFKVTTANIEFWGYPYSFRKEPEHPVSVVVDDFVIKDELYHFQPSTRDFHVIARAENLPVMWWHPVGNGKVMSLTLGHDEHAKSNPGYQNLLRHGVQWLLGMPLIHSAKPKVVSNRNSEHNKFMTLTASAHSVSSDAIQFRVIDNTNPAVFTAQSSPSGKVDLKLTGKPGAGQFIVSAKRSDGLSSVKAYDIEVVKDGVGNIASYYGNTATSSSNENQSAVFAAMNVLDNDSTTRWSSAPVDSAWIVVDLQKMYAVKQIVLEWESSFARDYTILGSQDGKSWKSLVTVAGGDGEIDTHNFSASQIRYVKVNMTERANKKWGYSLYEVKVYQ